MYSKDLRGNKRHFGSTIGDIEWYNYIFNKKIEKIEKIGKNIQLINFL